MQNMKANFQKFEAHMNDRDHKDKTEEAHLVGPDLENDAVITKV